MKKKEEAFSAVILAGGLSTRMGTSKAEIIWDGKSLIARQVNKMRALGIEDIIISGYPNPIEGTRFVPDKYLLKGPLGGIHAGLLAAENAHCLVTGIDTPLVPEDTLLSLMQTHIRSSNNITVLSHGDKIEPIIAVYERWLGGIAEDILQSDDTSVRRLLHRVGYSKLPYAGDEALLCDCNTPEELEEAKIISNDI